MWLGLCTRFPETSLQRSQRQRNPPRPREGRHEHEQWRPKPPSGRGFRNSTSFVLEIRRSSVLAANEESWRMKHNEWGDWTLNRWQGRSINSGSRSETRIQCPDSRLFSSATILGTKIFSSSALRSLGRSSSRADTHRFASFWLGSTLGDRVAWGHCLGDVRIR